MKLSLAPPPMRSSPFLLVPLVAALGACASHRPPAELVDARAAYARAAAGDASRSDPRSLADARRALDVAERVQTEQAGSEAARDLAYVAQRKALVAEASARTARAEAEAARAVELATTVRRGQLAAEENRLESAEDKADLEARPPSRRRAKEALDRLEPFAAVSESQGGTVVSMPASVLFEGDTAELMTTARERLDRVAEAVLEVRPRSVLVRGHTDRSGDDRRDGELSRRRAAAVRQYLITHGVAADHVRAEGAGNALPAASNASPEGRHDNRRVEIIVEAVAPKDGVKR